MWSALRSDFKEFVSTVKEDTTTVLSKIDDNFENEMLSPEEEEALRRMKLKETFTAPLLRGDNDDDDDDDEGYKEIIQEFLESFSIDAVTEEIAQELQDKPVLQQFMDELVPQTVTYKDFWMRYFYRCSPEWILRENEMEEERERQRRTAAVVHSLEGVKSFLGGAVSAVSASLKEDDDGQPTERSNMGFFGTGARPPFVMNTAVDEDEDEEDAEEELGWDDDDEDDEGDDDADETSEQIVFQDAATEQLQEELRQTIEERDALQQTVAMQAREIKELSLASADETAKKEIERLMMQLYEKESEMAAIKESTLNISSISHESKSTLPPEDGMKEKLAALEAKQVELETQLASKEKEIARLVSELDSTRNELKAKETQQTQGTDAAVASLQASLQESQGEKLALTAQVDSLNELIASLRAENETLRANMASSESTASAELAESQRELETATQQIATLSSQLDHAQMKLSATEQQVELLKTELMAAKAVPEKDPSPTPPHEEQDSAVLSSPDTVSTGVKVDTPPRATKINGDEEDDWGDDWGDDDDV